MLQYLISLLSHIISVLKRTSPYPVNSSWRNRLMLLWCLAFAPMEVVICITGVMSRSNLITLVRKACWWMMQWQFRSFGKSWSPVMECNKSWVVSCHTWGSVCCDRHQLFNRNIFPPTCFSNILIFNSSSGAFQRKQCQKTLFGGKVIKHHSNKHSHLHCISEVHGLIRLNRKTFTSCHNLLQLSHCIWMVHTVFIPSGRSTIAWFQFFMVLEYSSTTAVSASYTILPWVNGILCNVKMCTTLKLCLHHNVEFFKKKI